MSKIDGEVSSDCVQRLQAKHTQRRHDERPHPRQAGVSHGLPPPLQLADHGYYRTFAIFSIGVRNNVGVHTANQTKNNTRYQSASAAEASYSSSTKKKNYLRIAAALKVSPSEVQVQDGHSQAPHVEAAIHRYAGVLFPSGPTVGKHEHFPSETVGQEEDAQKRSSQSEKRTRREDLANQMRRSEKKTRAANPANQIACPRKVGAVYTAYHPVPKYNERSY